MVDILNVTLSTATPPRICKLASSYPNPRPSNPVPLGRPFNGDRGMALICQYTYTYRYKTILCLKHASLILDVKSQCQVFRGKSVGPFLGCFFSLLNRMDVS